MTGGDEPLVALAQRNLQAFSKGVEKPLGWAGLGPARRSQGGGRTLEESFFQASRAALCADVGAFVDAISLSDYFGPAREVSASLADWTRRQFISTPLPVLLESQHTFSHADLSDELSKLSLPVLVIHGSADTFTPLELTGKRAAALAPDSRLVVIDGGGHGIYAGDAARYNAELITFARACLSADTWSDPVSLDLS